jgi:hypothetical protein
MELLVTMVLKETTFFVLVYEPVKIDICHCLLSSQNTQNGKS